MCNLTTMTAVLAAKSRPMNFFRYASAALLAACSQSPAPPTGTGPDTTYTVEKLQDPETCKDCHPKQYTEWSGSMHAYASDDPLFLALNKRGLAADISPFC